MTTTTSREVRLKQRPVGLPKPSDFELATTTLGPAGPGQMLIRNVFMSVDPYMRGRMVDRESYVPPFQVGAPLDGGAVGQVVESNGGPHPVGAYVVHMAGWREFALSSGAGVMPVDPRLPLSAYLGVLGMPGLTAYAGLLKHGRPKAGETVFVSAAAGAVGSLVCQIAKILGCTVIGTAGSDDKVAYLLNEVGCDYALNYKTCGDLTKAIADKLPKGIDVYFENVGGAHLVAALNLLRPFGRIAVCGMIEQYNASSLPDGPGNFIQVIPKRISITGFVVSDHFDMMPEFMTDMSKWIAEGKIKWRETVYDGIDKATEAFLGLFHGDNLGKAVVRLGPDKI